MSKLLLILTANLFLLTMAGTTLADNKSNLTLKILCDDTIAADKYVTEHGLSILVELPNGHNWLVDVGTTDIFLQNAELLRTSLDNLTGIALTHGHDDHSGGLTFYPRLQGKPPVYGHPYIWHKQYHIKKDKPVRILTMPYLARQHANPVFKPVNNTAELDENLFFFTDVPREPGSYSPVKYKFFNEDATGPCPITDDATVVVKTERGLVAIFGCAHAGYINILKAIHEKFPNEKLLAAVGGLHLKSASDEVLTEAVAVTKEIKSDDFTFHGGHCTGDKAIARFKEAFGEQAVKPLGSGRVIEL